MLPQGHAWRRALRLRLLPLGAGVCGLVIAPAVWAARPFVTDDARIVAARACQLETWGQVGPAGNEYWAAPACNFTGNLELTAGVALLPEDGAGPSHPATLLQAKTLFRSLSANGWGIGLATGGLIDNNPSENENLLGNVYGYVPASVSLAAGRLVVHGNIGVRYERRDGSTRGTGGIGAELQLLQRLVAVVETYGTHREGPFAQMGARIWVVPEYVQLDATYGLKYPVSGSDHWVSVGLRLLSPPLF